jgi:putative endonuclease
MKPKYKRMLDGMQRLAEQGVAYGGGDPWFLYILECSDGSFYTGVTKDIERRLGEHNQGKASRYTRTRRPVKLLYFEPCSDRAAALVRECAVKALSRKQKERLVENGI